MKRVRIDSLNANLKSALRNLKFAILLCAMLLALSYSASAQQPAKVPRIGYLTAAPLSAQSTRIEAFRQGLRELGYGHPPPDHTGQNQNRCPSKGLKGRSYGFSLLPLFQAGRL